MIHRRGYPYISPSPKGRLILRGAVIPSCLRSEVILNKWGFGVTVPAGTAPCRRIGYQPYLCAVVLFPPAPLRLKAGMARLGTRLSQGQTQNHSGLRGTLSSSVGGWWPPTNYPNMHSYIKMTHIFLISSVVSANLALPECCF